MFRSRTRRSERAPERWRFRRTRRRRRSRSCSTTTESVDRREIEDVTELRALRETRARHLGRRAGARATRPRSGRSVTLFELHPVALENAVNVPQRAKTELYEHHQLVIARTPIDRRRRAGPHAAGLLRARQALPADLPGALFRLLRSGARAPPGGHRRRCAAKGPTISPTRMIDAMIDRYYPVAQRLSDSLEELEDVVVENPHPDVLARIHALRRQLVVLASGRLAAARGRQRDAARADALLRRPGEGLPARHLRPHRADRRADRLVARDGLRSRRRLPLERQPSHQRDHEGADADGEHLHPADLRRRHLRHELREHAGAEQPHRLLRRLGRDDLRRGRHDVLLQASRLDRNAPPPEFKTDRVDEGGD